MNFQDVLVECCLNQDLIREFNRLSNTNLSFKDDRKPIERMIDDATKYPYPFKVNHYDMQKFISFCLEFVWLPLISQSKV